MTLGPWLSLQLASVCRSQGTQQRPNQNPDADEPPTFARHGGFLREKSTFLRETTAQGRLANIVLDDVLP